MISGIGKDGDSGGTRISEEWLLFPLGQTQANQTVITTISLQHRHSAELAHTFAQMHTHTLMHHIETPSKCLKLKNSV